MLTCLTCLVGIIHAQVNFHAIPSDLQLIPRGTNASGTFTISGNCPILSYKQIRSVIIDNSANTLIEDKISSIDGAGNFSAEHSLKALLKEYTLNVYLKSAVKDSLIKTVSNLVCGDVFVICGQSNAMAAIDPPEGTAQNNSYSNKFCRGIGFGIDYAQSANISYSRECEFARPSCIYWEKGFVGGWGIKLQNELAGETGVPVCIVNGAKSSSAIIHNLPSRFPLDSNFLNPDLPYDRIYKKLHFFGLEKSVKAIFWYQGETDGGANYETAQKYKDNFTALYNSWKADYKDVKQIFMLQINTGCGGHFNGLIADMQRKISSDFSDISVMSTVGSDASDRKPDECHYTCSGYNRIADKLLPLVKKHIFNYQIPDEYILPPNIKRAYVYYNNTICMEFDKDVVFKNSLEINGSKIYLKDHFYGENYEALEIRTIRYTGNKIYLEFKNNYLPEKITYLPNNYSSFSLYVGPWIFNSSNTVGAFSFYEFAVEPFEKINAIENGNITIYPNPSAGKLTLSINTVNDLMNNITVSDRNGRIIMEEKTERKNVKLDLTGFQSGAYLIRVVNSEGAYVKKLLLNL